MEFDGVTPDRPFRFYTAGPMSKIRNHNNEAFAEAKKRLERRGIDVLSPAENFGGAVVEAMRPAYMRRDFFQVLRADAVVVLPGWEDSDGTKAELVVAREVGIPVLDLEHLQEIGARMRITPEWPLALREETA